MVPFFSTIYCIPLVVGSKHEAGEAYLEWYLISVGVVADGSDGRKCRLTGLVVLSRAVPTSCHDGTITYGRLGFTGASRTKQPRIGGTNWMVTT